MGHPATQCRPSRRATPRRFTVINTDSVIGIPSFPPRTAIITPGRRGGFRAPGKRAGASGYRCIEYRGRGRQTVWDGTCTLEGNRFERAAPINFWNLDKKLKHSAPGALKWAALTTGGFGGFDASLADPSAGTLRIDTPLVKTELAIAGIGYEDQVFANGGIRRQIRVFRLPDEHRQHRLKLERRIRLQDLHDNALYVRVTQEDGHLIWSSPIYVFR